MSLQEDVSQAFDEYFGGVPDFVVRAPGRVNLIGEHTDYNDGFVLPMAINRAIWIALRQRTDSRVLLHSPNFYNAADFDLHDFKHADEGWMEYVKGMAWSLQSAGHTLSGWEGVLRSDVPIGAGLSSSAALQMSVAQCFAAVSNLEWDATSIARRAQIADHDWVGIKSGIMDQMICGTAVAQTAMLLDCRSLERRYVPLPEDTSIVILDTSSRRGLLDSAYNERRAQCEAAAAAFNVPALRDLTLDTLAENRGKLDALQYRRAQHVVSENRRTLQAFEAMQQGDAIALGKLMNASHESLRDDFEVSSHELDAIVTCAQSEKGCLGARMTGGGFGGSAVAIVRSAAVNEFVANVKGCYLANTDLTANVYVCEASQGTEVVSAAA